MLKYNHILFFNIIVGYEVAVFQTLIVNLKSLLFHYRSEIILGYELF